MADHAAAVPPGLFPVASPEGSPDTSTFPGCLHPLLYPGRRSCPSGCRRVTIPASISILLLLLLAPFASPSAPGASLLLTAAFCFNPRVLLEEELPSDKAIRILVHVSFGLLLNWK